jgi:L-ascorbate metabolism protein UlaG (beta-lactamase superfamily)
MKLTYFGHSCFLIDACGTRLLFDPFITPNPLAASIDTAAIAADFILISHGHVDHLADAVDLAGKTGAKVISNWEVIDWFGKNGVANTHPMNHGGSVVLPWGRVKMVSAVHSSALPDGSNGGNPAGFVVETGEGSFYYAGDTALTMDMKLIADEFQLRCAILPIGDNFTMGAADAVRAAGFCGAKDVVGVHYNTFPPIKIDTREAEVMFSNAGLKLHLPSIGGSVHF